MSFGFNFMLPAFTGLYIGGKYLNIKWMKIISFFAFIEVVIFANKGSALAALFIVFLFNVIPIKKSINKKSVIIKGTFLYGIIFIGCYLVWNNLTNMLNFLINLTDKLNFNSYSLSTFKNMLIYNSFEIGLTGREILWQKAIEYFKINFLIGNGTAAFHSSFGVYPHNFILEIITSYGLLGLCVFFIIWSRSFKVMLNSAFYDKIFYMIIFSLWFIPLFFSLNIFESKEFWVFMIIGFKEIHAVVKKSTKTHY
ncbi:O-antigen ligase family protein [Virgibacillus pantothenticus]|nr:O-antigen ligase family protein [Virgibacillus pantothenticus]MED3736772.1 hypothetical protein [Virgibacillus pantothenticus]QTY15214.1 hypothetical protein KBP50_15060 [Virgibacillus pantothenticus]